MAMSKMSHLLFKQNSQQPKQFRGGEKKVMKKSLSLLVAIAMVFSMFASMVSAAEQTAGEKLKDLGVITGTSEGLQEDAEWRRADVAILVSRLYGKEDVAKATAPNHGFTDLTDKTYGAYVTWAKEEGLFLGKTETTFGPLDNITNGQFATVVLRALGQDQLDEAKNLAKAIELGLLAEGTVQTDAAKRGTTYSALVAALDVKVDGKKLGTKLGLKGYEIVDLAIESASAVVAKEIVVNFNDNVKEIAVKDVSVKDAEGNSVAVEKVSIKDAKATVALATALTSGKEYTVSIAAATGVEATALTNGAATFTYTKGIPASVAFSSTTVVAGKTAGYVVKDAAGNDITADYGVDNFDVYSSNDNVISSADGEELKADSSAAGEFAVVSLTLIDDEKVTTGNVTINVVSALAVKVKDLKSDANNNIIHLNDDGTANTANLEFDIFLDNASSAAYTEADLGSNDFEAKFTSSNPAVVTVNQAGLLTGVAKGTATITLTVKYEGKTTTETVSITVREAQKATSFKLDKTSVTVVKDVAIDEEVTVTVLDQYGDAIQGIDVDLNVSKTAAITVEGQGSNTAAVDFTLGQTDSKGKISFAVESTSTTGSATITVKVDGISKSQKVAAKSVNAATAKGYEVRVDEKKIDSNATGTASGKEFAAKATVYVYVKDVNGNRIDVVAPSDFDLDEGQNAIVTVNGAEITAKSNAEGTAKVKVVINNITVETVSIEVAPSSPKFVKSITQVKSTINVKYGDDLEEALFGGNGVFAGKNAAGDNVNIDDAVNVTPVVVSNNTDIVDANGDLTNSATGTVILTVVLNGSVYTVNVNVSE